MSKTTENADTPTASSSGSYVALIILLMVTGCSIQVKNQEPAGSADSVVVQNSQKVVYLSGDTYRVPLSATIRKKAVYYLTTTRRPAAPAGEGLVEYALCRSKVESMREYRLYGNCVRVLK